MLIDELERFNPWWKTGAVPPERAPAYRRPLFDEAQRFLELRQAVLIWGIRRTGKTTLAHQLIQSLLAKGIAPKAILYFSFDDASFDLGDALEAFQKLVIGKTFEHAGRAYLFLDEVQKVPDWESKLKIYYDLYPNLKFILTGSASISLRRGSGESLAGRVIPLRLDPLPFEEFLTLSGIPVDKVKESPALWKREVVPLFYKHLRQGGFPELAGTMDEEGAKRIIKSMVERVIYKDLQEEFGIRDLALLKALASLALSQPGTLVDFKGIASNLGRDQRTVSSYFELLEYSLLIRFLHNYRGSPLASARKLKKAYPATPSLSHAHSDGAVPLPSLLEAFVVSETGAEFFYRDSFEVDAIIPQGDGVVAIEIKAGAARPGQLKKLANMLGGKVKKAYIVTLEEEGISDAYEDEVEVFPAWRFVLEKPYLQSQARP